ncbi:hypothetical protein M9Y10_029465 [Tritrichomonas musculus]|uniref:Integral membrane protein n=1 Tax=Tritrichomonas musculus TaxID=1915356 RepID=A0ABR2KMV0_9EUKA
MVFLVSISFFFVGAKKGFVRLILCIISQSILLPIGISIGIQNWIVLGAFLGYYVILYPITLLISNAINKCGKKWIHFIMILLYIPATIFGFLLSFFYVSVIGANRRIIPRLMPWMKVFDLNKINQFYAEPYIYFNRQKRINDNPMSHLGSLFISIIIFDLLTLYILGTNWIWYILIIIGAVLFILLLIEIVRKVYFVSYTMIYLSFYMMIALIKLFDLIIMPAISLFVDTDPDSIPKHAKASISIFAIIIPLLVITIITILIILQSKSFHPVLFCGWLGTSVTVAMIVDGFKYNCLWFPLINYIYSILFSILTAFTKPYYCIAISAIFVIFVIFVRPCLFPVDNIITCGEPLIIILYNIILLTYKKMPFWVAIFIVVLAFVPLLLSFLIYYFYQKKREWMITKNDMVTEMSKRNQPIPFIDESKKLKVFEHGHLSFYFEEINYKYLLYHSRLKPEDVLLIDEDDFPSSSSFTKKNIDYRSDFYIDVFNIITLTLGTFFMFIEFGYSI